MFLLDWLTCSCPSFPAPLDEEIVFSSLNILASFVKDELFTGLWIYSGLSTLFHWSMCLFLCQKHTVLIIVAFVYCLKSEGQCLLLCTFPQDYLAILSLFWFRLPFRIICFNSVKNVTGILIPKSLFLTARVLFSKLKLNQVIPLFKTFNDFPFHSE